MRVTHPGCETNIHKNLQQIYKEQEELKKRTYEERIIESEKGSFTPLIFTTSGGSGPLCHKFLKTLASAIAESKNEKYDDVIYHLRVRIRFAILRCTLMALRGQRGRKVRIDRAEDTSFNLIPEPFHRREKT